MGEDRELSPGIRVLLLELTRQEGADGPLRQVLSVQRGYPFELVALPLQKHPHGQECSVFVNDGKLDGVRTRSASGSTVLSCTNGSYHNKMAS